MKSPYLASLQLLLGAAVVWGKPPCELGLTELARFSREPIVAVNREGTRAVALGRGELVPVAFSLRSDRPPQVLPSHPVPVVAAASSLSRLALSGEDGNVEVSTVQGAPLYRIDPFRRITRELTFSPQGRYLLAVEPHFVSLHLAHDGTPVRWMGGEGIFHGQFSAVTPHVGTISSAGRSQLWSLYDVAQPGLFKVAPSTTLDRGGVALTTLAFAPRQPLLATGSQKGRVAVWDLHSKRLLTAGQSTASPVTSLSFNLDGSRLLSTNREGLGQVWNAGTGRSPVVLPAERHGAMTAGHLIRNGQYALTAHGDGGVRLWELDSPIGGRRHATLLYEYSGHEGPVVEIRMLPNGEFLSVGADGTLRKGIIPRLPTDP